MPREAKPWLCEGDRRAGVVLGPRTTRNGAAGAEMEQRGRARRQARSRPPAQPEESPQLPGRDRQYPLERGHIRELCPLRRIAHHHGAAAAYDAAVQHQVVDEA